MRFFFEFLLPPVVDNTIRGMKLPVRLPLPFVGSFHVYAAHP
jgi:hypothetical protein